MKYIQVNYFSLYVRFQTNQSEFVQISTPTSMDLLRDIKDLFSWVTNAYIKGGIMHATFPQCSCQRGNDPKYYVAQEKVRIGVKTIEDARLVLIDKVKSVPDYHYTEVNVMQVTDPPSSFDL